MPKQTFKPTQMVGTSSQMLSLFNKMGQVVKSDATVLIRGESGTGKHLTASTLYKNGLRATMPFVSINCATLPPNIIESELFGQEEGDGVGQRYRRKGRIELAEGGTLFLDEVAALPLHIQDRLMRLLEEKSIVRMGGREAIRLNVRLVVATERNLEEEIRLGNFREDLFYRLNAFPLHLPPLREHKSDIVLLTDFFIEKFNQDLKRNIKRISTAAINMLMSYHFPGNIQELANAIERGILSADGEVIHSTHLPPSLQTTDSSNTPLTTSLPEALAIYEKALICDALKNSAGNQAKAARYLGISERQMGCRVDKYKIDVKGFKDS